MIKVLTFDVPPLVRLLRSAYFRSLGLRVTTAPSADKLLELAVWLSPDLVLVVGERTPPGHARALRACLGERRAQMVLVVGENDAPFEDELTAYDGIVSLAEPELELARLIALQAPRSRRRQARSRVRLPAALVAPDEMLADGVLLDMSDDGAGLLISRLPERTGPYELKLRRGDGRTVSARARVVWADARAEPAVRVGVRLLDVTPERTRALADLALWELDQVGDATIIRLHGELDERADLSSLVAALVARDGRTPIVDLGDVVRANSAGLLRWSTFLRALPRDTAVRLRRVPAALMRQLLLVPLATLGCTIESYRAPYDCEVCETDIDLLIDARDPPSVQPCPLCAAPMSCAETVLRFGGAPDRL